MRYTYEQNENKCENCEIYVRHETFEKDKRTCEIY